MGKQYLNGVLYGTGEIVKFSPYIYSLEEREVGVWTDGKPLYQKTVHISSLPNTAYTQIEYPHNIVNIDKICDFQAFVMWTTGEVAHLDHLALPSESLTAIARPSMELTVSKSSIKVRCGMDRSPLSADVTIRYTKTTDTPGSGHYTTKGGEAHHYSTSEQIVGTWIDGKPLYEKTIVGNALGNSSTTTTLFTATVEKIQKYDTTIKNASNNVCNSNMLYTGSYYYRVVVDTDGSLKLIRSNADAWQDWHPVVTVQYTKTTD